MTNLHPGDQPSVADVRAFRERHPVAAAAIPHPIGSTEYFRCYDELREANESPDASFTGRAVLDVGSGNGYVLEGFTDVEAWAGLLQRWMLPPPLHRLVPARLLRPLERRFGWFLYVKARRS